jgi:flagellar motor protein MotB
MAIREQGEEGGEGYFASVSDLMVGILFVFLLVLTVFALNYREEEQKQEISRAELEAAKKQAEAAETEARRQTERADQLRQLLAEAAAQLQREIDASSNACDRLLSTLETTLTQRGIQVRVDRQAGILHLPGDLLFNTLSATLGPRQRDNVDILADVLAQTVRCFTPIVDRTRCDSADLPILETVLVEGHTDRRPIGNANTSFRDNDQLSTERALAVFAELRRVQPGLDALMNADRSNPLLGVSGFGDRRPLPQAQGDTEADYTLHRRIDLRFLLAGTAALERLHRQIKAALQDSGK